MQLTRPGAGKVPRRKKGADMTKKELAGLKPGTVLYNGHTEGVITMDGKIKCIEVLIPIYCMSNDSNHVDERPDGWDVLDI